MSFVVGARGDSPYYISLGADPEVAYICKDRFVYINKIRVVDGSAATGSITIEFYNSIDNVYVLLANEEPVPANGALELWFDPLKLYLGDNITTTSSNAGQHILIQTMTDGQPKAS